MIDFGTIKRLTPSFALIMIAVFGAVDLFPGLYSFREGIRATILLFLIWAAIAAGLIVSGLQKSNISILLCLATLFPFIGTAQYEKALFLLGFYCLIALFEKNPFSEKILNAFFILATSYLAIFTMLKLTTLTNFPSAPFRTDKLSQNNSLKSRPHIVHIVLDSYPSSSVLKRYYNYDNSAFLNQLSESGFIVFADVEAAFNQTLPTVASVLNGGIVDFPQADIGRKNYRASLKNLIQEASVLEILRQNGYKIYSSDNGFKYIEIQRSEIVNSQSNFDFTGLDSDIFLFWHKGLRSRIHKRRLETALNISIWELSESPFFYYQHLIAPHPPFFYDSEGGSTEIHFPDFRDGANFHRKLPEHRKLYTDLFANKIKVVERGILRQMNNITDSPVIIFIHGDHGPRAFEGQSSHFCPLEIQSTFAAVYSNIPKINSAFGNIEKDEFNLINIYRIVFSELGDEKFELLENQPVYMNWSNPHYHRVLSKSELQKPCKEIY